MSRSPDRRSSPQAASVRDHRRVGAPRVWIDGSLVAAAEARVSVFDHGLVVGDGAFETCRIVDGTAFALTRHLRRLARSAAALGLDPPDTDLLRIAVADTIAANPPDHDRLRITLTSGPGPLGSGRGPGPSTMIVATSSGPPADDAATVVLVPWRRNEHGALTGIKSTSYAENVVALAEARRRGASEAVFCNTAGELCEGTGSNVFVVSGGELVTPPLASGCLDGVTRALVIQLTGAVERPIDPAELHGADEAFLTSSTRDVQPIAFVDSTALPAAPGTVTTTAAEAFAALVARELDP